MKGKTAEAEAKARAKAGRSERGARSSPIIDEEKDSADSPKKGYTERANV